MDWWQGRSTPLPPASTKPPTGIMKPRIGFFFVVLGTFCPLFLSIGCQGQADPSGSGPTGDGQARPEPRQLLSLAHDAAMAMPLNPHRKDRARAQEVVVSGCLQLDLPDLADGYARKIMNWRRGTCFGDLAIYYARKGNAQRVKTYEDLAEQVAKGYKGWREDRIRVRLAKAQAILGRAEQTKTHAERITEDSEIGKVAGYHPVAEGDGEAARIQVEAISKAIAEQVRIRNLDVMQNLLRSAAVLHGRFHQHPELRKELLDLVKTGMTEANIPIFMRVELFLEMARGSLKAGDRQGAGELVATAQEIKDGARWPLRFGIPLDAKLAKAWSSVGQDSRAEKLADGALKTFNESLKVLLNFDRAEILQQIAEAYQGMGDPDKAHEVYRLAVTHGAINPNLRPRAEDLCGTAVSMAVHGVMPDAELWARMQEIRNSLGTEK